MRSERHKNAHVTCADDEKYIYLFRMWVRVITAGSQHNNDANRKGIAASNRRTIPPHKQSKSAGSYYYVRNIGHWESSPFSRAARK